MKISHHQNLSADFVVTFTNESRHVCGWGMFSSGIKRGSVHIYSGGNVLSRGREGRPIEDDIIAFPIRHLQDGKGFFIAGDNGNSLLHALSSIAFRHEKPPSVPDESY